MEHPVNHPKLPHSSYPLPFTLVCVSYLIALTLYLLPWCVSLLPHTSYPLPFILVCLSHLIALTLYLLPVCVSLLPHTFYLLPLIKHVHGTAVTFST